MEQKNRLMIVMAVTLLILTAMLFSFGRSLFALNTPSVSLPADPASPGGSSPGQPAPEQDHFLPVEITPQTVQDMIRTLSRSTSYYRELSVERFWDDESTLSSVQTWVDGDWSHSMQTLPSGVIRHDLIGDGTLSYWYSGSQQYLTVPADDHSADLSQKIPTYETILELDPEQIVQTSYELRGEIPCIYVETQNPSLNLTTRFWVNIDSGLLVSAEQDLAGELVYRMTSYGPVLSPCPASASFTLPDGTMLHQPN